MYLVGIVWWRMNRCGFGFYVFFWFLFVLMLFMWFYFFMWCLCVSSWGFFYMYVRDGESELGLWWICFDVLMGFFFVIGVVLDIILWWGYVGRRIVWFILLDIRRWRWGWDWIILIFFFIFDVLSVILLVLGIVIGLLLYIRRSFVYILF